MFAVDDTTDMDISGLVRTIGSEFGRGSEVLVAGNMTAIAVRISQLTRILVDEATGRWFVCLLGI